MKRKVVLYNPRADFYTMPLALLSLGSSLERERYDVRIVDARVEDRPLQKLVYEIEGALALGITVLTGRPIVDALRATRAAKNARPDLPVAWGGWHPSLFPRETLLEAGIEATVQGQGERTFAEILERLQDGRDLEGVEGCTYREGEEAVSNPPRALSDLSLFPPLDYDLVDPGRYYALKGQRQLDYLTSVGCRFRCTFCADPTVYRRGWFGLAPERIGDDLERLSRRHPFDDLAFQDETFFTSAKRVAAIASEILKRGLRFRWMATLRADQGSRIDEAVLAECRRAGLRRVMVGLESGSQAMLDWMKKDVTLAQAFETAEKCRRLGIAALFNLIVGFPGEPPESVDHTLDVAKKLRSMGPELQIALFYYRPYPGTEITDALARDGYPLPSRLEDWAAIEEGSAKSPWVDPEKKKRIERFKFYQQVAWAPWTPIRAPLQAIARWRCRRDDYRYPLEKVMVEWIRPLAPQG